MFNSVKKKCFHKTDPKLLRLSEKFFDRKYLHVRFLSCQRDIKNALSIVNPLMHLHVDEAKDLLVQ